MTIIKLKVEKQRRKCEQITLAKSLLSELVSWAEPAPPADKEGFSLPADVTRAELP
jgi:hypothetical protein